MCNIRNNTYVKITVAGDIIEQLQLQQGLRFSWCAYIHKKQLQNQYFEVPRIFSDSTYGVRCRPESFDDTTAKCHHHVVVRIHLIRVHEFALDYDNGTYGVRCRLEAFNGT